MAQEMPVRRWQCLLLPLCDSIALFSVAGLTLARPNASLHRPTRTRALMLSSSPRKWQALSCLWTLSMRRRSVSPTALKVRRVARSRQVILPGLHRVFPRPICINPLEHCAGDLVELVRKAICGRMVNSLGLAVHAAQGTLRIAPGKRLVWRRPVFH
jgi:hypothetical protein